MHHDTITVRLDLRVDDDTLTGHLRADDGTTRAFTGRLELMAAIEATIAAPPADATTEVAR